MMSQNISWVTIRVRVPHDLLVRESDLVQQEVRDRLVLLAFGGRENGACVFPGGRNQAVVQLHAAALGGSVQGDLAPGRKHQPQPGSLLDGLMNANSATKPRMMPIKNLAKNGPVGVLKRCCTMGPARIYPWRKMHRSRAPSIAPGTFFVGQPWADCITNMPDLIYDRHRYLFVHHRAHHGPDKLPLPLLKHHRSHHQFATRNYGVSTTLWDHVFGTVLR